MNTKTFWEQTFNWKNTKKLFSQLRRNNKLSKKQRRKHNQDYILAKYNQEATQ